MEINGKVLTILPIVKGQGKNGEWKKQDFVIQTESQYPKSVCFSIWGDKIDQNPFAVGDMVTVFFEPESREYNGKWYTELRSWRVSKTTEKPQTASSAGENFTPSNEQPVSFDESSDDLPF
ncbi:MAG: DUF3127 domain-containing protein [Bacteroidia bacterium]